MPSNVPTNVFTYNTYGPILYPTETPTKRPTISPNNDPSKAPTYVSTIKLSK